MGNHQSVEDYNTFVEDSAHQLFSVSVNDNRSSSFSGLCETNRDQTSTNQEKLSPLKPLIQKTRSGHISISGSGSSAESLKDHHRRESVSLSPRPRNNYRHRMDQVDIEKKPGSGKRRRNVIKAAAPSSSSVPKKSFILSPPTTIKTERQVFAPRKADSLSSIPYPQSDPLQRDALYIMSSSPYSFMMRQKEAIEAKSQLRLLESRQAFKSSFQISSNEPLRLNSQQEIERDSMHSFSSSATSAASSLNTNAQPKSSQDQSESCSQPLNKPKNFRRRAEYNKSAVDDLCEIVADLSIAESNLLDVHAISPKEQLRLINLPQVQTTSEIEKKKKNVMFEVRQFVENFPLRYSFSIQSPSEVLVHMRLVAVARSDEYRAAVHIVKIEKAERICTVNARGSDSNVRLVTISCSDRNGLLEYITKLLSSCGSRVLDADVMTTRDNIALDRFTVEMNGRLRLDKLQELIEKYLKESRPPKPTVTEPLLKDVADTVTPKCIEENVRSDSLRNPITLDKTLDKVDDCGLVLPIYVRVPKSSNMSKKLSVEAELENAVSLTDIIYCEKFDAASREASTRHSGFTFDSATSSYNSERVICEASNVLKHCSISLPISTHLNGRLRTRSFDHKPLRHGRKLSRAHSQQSTHSSALDSNIEPSSIDLSTKTTSECTAESSLRPDRGGYLVDRQARELSSGSHHDRISTKDQSVTELIGHGLLETALAQQSIRTVPHIPTNDLMILDRLGVGRISSIYRAVWMSQSQHKSPYQVALKVATMADHQCNVDELRREADISSQLEHPNICELKGICRTEATFCLAYEYCEGGSLMSLLSDTSRCYEYLPIAMDIAHGMAYLHARNVIHRDLKPANILLTGNNRAKISDFGLSVTNKGQELTAETGTYRWMAPEVIRHESYSSNADVYSFGVVLWQLITRSIPFATMTPIQTAYAVAHGHRPDIPPFTPIQLRKIIESCWDEDSQKRPSFTYIAMALADYACKAFNPANVGLETVMIANEIMEKVEGNSTVNVDFSTSFLTPRGSKIIVEDGASRSSSSEIPLNSYLNQGPSSSYSGVHSVGLEI